MLALTHSSMRAIEYFALSDVPAAQTMRKPAFQMIHIDGQISSATDMSHEPSPFN